MEVVRGWLTEKVLIDTNSQKSTVHAREEKLCSAVKKTAVRWRSV